MTYYTYDVKYFNTYTFQNVEAKNISESELLSLQLYFTVYIINTYTHTGEPVPPENIYYTYNVRYYNPDNNTWELQFDIDQYELEILQSMTIVEIIGTIPHEGGMPGNPGSVTINTSRGIVDIDNEIIVKAYGVYWDEIDFSPILKKQVNPWYTASSFDCSGLLMDQGVLMTLIKFTYVPETVVEFTYYRARDNKMLYSTRVTCNPGVVEPNWSWAACYLCYNTGLIDENGDYYCKLKWWEKGHSDQFYEGQRSFTVTGLPVAPPPPPPITRTVTVSITNKCFDYGQWLPMNIITFVRCIIDGNEVSVFDTIASYSAEETKLFTFEDEIPAEGKDYTIKCFELGTNLPLGVFTKRLSQEAIPPAQRSPLRLDAGISFNIADAQASGMFLEATSIPPVPEPEPVFTTKYAVGDVVQRKSFVTNTGLITRIVQTDKIYYIYTPQVPSYIQTALSQYDVDNNVAPWTYTKIGTADVTPYTQPPKYKVGDSFVRAGTTSQFTVTEIYEVNGVVWYKLSMNGTIYQQQQLMVDKTW